MADQKISVLTALTGADVDDANDELAIVDDSAGQTKKITRAQLMSSVASISADTVNIGGSVYTSFSGGAIGGLVTGSTFGGLIQGQNTGHFVIGIRENNSGDSFAIVSGGGNYTTDSVYDTLVASFRADGKVGIGKNNPNQSLDVAGNIAVSGTVDGRDVSVDGSKLDGIETNADVTDTANVRAAGALMDDEVTNLAALKAVDQALTTTSDVTFQQVQVTQSDAASPFIFQRTDAVAKIEGSFGGGDSAIRYSVNGAASFIVGIDDSDGDAFKISYGPTENADFGTNDYLSVTTSGDVAITGSLTIGGGSSTSWADSATIADDAVATFTPPFRGGYIQFGVNLDITFPQSQMSTIGFIDTGSSLDYRSIYTGAIATVLTNDQDLTVTAGVDGDMTYSVRSNGTIQVNNRTASALSVNVLMEGML